MEKIRINAVIDMDRKERLFQALLEERRTFTAWLRRQIDSHLRKRRLQAEEYRTNSMGLWTYAEDYFKAASAVEERFGSRPKSITYFLYCRAIELVLKAYLRSREIGLKPLMRLGHDLDALMDAADRENLKSLVTLNADQLDAIERINTDHVGKELEYIVTGYKQYPSIENLRSSAEALIRATTGVCIRGRERKPGKGA